MAVGVMVLTPMSAWPAQTQPQRQELVARMVRWTGVSPKAVVSSTPEFIVALLRRGSKDAGGVVSNVEIEGEIIDDTLIQTRGWRSMRTSLRVNCLNQKTRIDAMDIYAEHGRRGGGTPAKIPAGWVQPSDGAYLMDVVGAVCGGAGSRVPAPIPTTTPVQVAAAEPQTPPPASLSYARPPAPSSPPAALSGPAPQPAAPMAAPSRRPGAALVQIAALPTQEEAEAALKALTDHTPLSAGLSTRIEPAVVHGKRYYRTQITGFSSADDAERFCAQIRGSGGACFVR
jgi:cell division septation protein DedD